MAFEQGSVGFRMLVFPRSLPEDAVERFAQHTAPPLTGGGSGSLSGWVTGRHLLDRQINEETAHYGGWLRLTLLLAERKIPASLLRAECRMEELALQAAEGKAFLNRNQRAEIKKAVTDRLLPTMPPQLKGLAFVHRPEDPTVYTDALPTGACDRLCARFQSTLGFAPHPLTPEAAALLRKRIDTADWHPTSFSPEVDDGEMEVKPGREFLTWLWFLAETAEDKPVVEGHGEIDLLIEGPLTFEHEGQGAHVITLRNGQPMTSAEAKTCLLSGKKLRQARLSLTQGDQVWSCTVDADGFAFRGLRLPESREASLPVARFQERMILLETFRDLFLGLYDAFLAERKTASAWKQTQQALHRWVVERTARA